MSSLLRVDSETWNNLFCPHRRAQARQAHPSLHESKQDICGCDRLWLAWWLLLCQCCSLLWIACISLVRCCLDWLGCGNDLRNSGGDLQVYLLVVSPTNGPLLAKKLATLSVLCQFPPLYSAHSRSDWQSLRASVYPQARPVSLDSTSVHLLGSVALLPDYLPLTFGWLRFTQTMMGLYRIWFFGFPFFSFPTASYDVSRRGMQCRPEIDRQADRQG